MKIKTLFFILSAISLSLNSCFTGVESTPRITENDVRKERISISAEERFLGDISAASPSDWQPGKKLRVTDSRISLVMTPASTANRDSLEGNDITFLEFNYAPSVTGEEVAQMIFSTEDGGTLVYATDIQSADLAERGRLQVPFTVELSMVDEVNSRMAGKRYYIVTPLWYDSIGGRAIRGLRHVPVDIVDVLPGNSNYPLLVRFRHEGSDDVSSVYMTVGNSRTSTRNFQTLFSFTNPRDKYPHIKPENWELIIHSRVKEGMTPDECRLALGSPDVIGQRPTTAGMVEYWSYSDGIYLLFQDGILISIR